MATRRKATKRAQAPTTAEPQQHQFLWLDLEMTGLNPEQDTILEVAAALVEDGPGGGFDIVDVFESVATGEVDGGQRRFRPDGEEEWINVHANVWQMHSVNGLWKDIADGGGLSVPEMDAALAEWLTERGATSRVMLAGFGVHFDLGFIRHHWPRVAKMLHYRIFDVRTITHATSLWAAPCERANPPVHRALADVVASVEAAKECRRLLTSAGAR